MAGDSDQRRPQAFDIDDPKLKSTMPEPDDLPPVVENADAAGDADLRMPTTADVKRGFRWGALFIGAAFTLSGLAIGLWFERFISVTLARDDWIGWVGFALVGLMIFAALMIIMRELIGLFRLSRLKDLRLDAEKALKDNDAKQARKLTKRLGKIYQDRHDLSWAMARFREHDGDILNGSEILKLADREIMAVLDGHAKALVAKAAKRVSLVTALSPAALLDVFYVLFENIRLLRGLAGLYGGRPGLLGALRLGRMVIVHIAATGGMALTDDLFGQFLGQDFIRRLSRRAGEGIFNGALTARIGIAAIDVCRPLPFIEVKPPRFRDFAVEVFKKRGS